MAYDEIYNSQNKWDKDYRFYRAFDAGESSELTLEPGASRVTLNLRLILNIKRGGRP